MAEPRLVHQSLGAGPPLVLLHGWAQSAALLHPLAAALAGEARVLLPELPGHGQSPPVTGGIAGWQRALRTWVETEVTAPAVAVGWSLGGLLLLADWPQLAERFRGLVLLASTPCFADPAGEFPGQPPAAVRALARQLRRSPAEALAGFRALMTPGDVAWPAELPAPDPASALTGLEVLAEVDARPQLDAIRCPLLLLHARDDRVIPAAAAQALAARVPQADLMLVDGGGHLPFVTQAEACAARIAAFCRSCHGD